eukprot:jgi/Botrbrau1/8834/Bobra.0335s0021.1
MAGCRNRSRKKWHRRHLIIRASSWIINVLKRILKHSVSIQPRFGRILQHAEVAPSSSLELAAPIGLSSHRRAGVQPNDQRQDKPWD